MHDQNYLQKWPKSKALLTTSWLHGWLTLSYISLAALNSTQTYIEERAMSCLELLPRSHWNIENLYWCFEAKEWLLGVQLRHFSPTCAVHIENFTGLWLSSCHNFVTYRALAAQARPMSGFDCQQLPAFSLCSIFPSKHLNFEQCHIKYLYMYRRRGGN